MHNYTVLTVAPAGDQHALLWLWDAAGRHHVARATAAAPRVGTRLLGNAPALGFGLLLGMQREEVYRVTFEAVNCTPDVAQESVHEGFAAAGHARRHAHPRPPAMAPH